jgi:hypothetical protein
MRRPIRLRPATLALWTALGILLCREWNLGSFAQTVERREQTAASREIAAQTAWSIAKEAYIYGFPMVDNYRVMHSFAVDRAGPGFLAPFNQIHNEARVFTPQDRTVPTPNSDTPYSMAYLDLRAEPIVLTIPPIEKNRYFSVQLVDLYTFNFDYIGSRTTGNDGGDYLLTGPNWSGEVDSAFKKVIRAQTEFVLAIYRTQLFKSDDLENVKKIQAAYQVRTMSGFLKELGPQPAAKLAFPAALSRAQERQSLEFFNILRFVLQFCPTQSDEQELRQRFARIGIVPGNAFEPAKLSAEIKQKLAEGMADGQKEIDGARAAMSPSVDYFGNRQALNQSYLNRAVGAQIGIYGNSRQEASYVIYQTGNFGQPLDGGKNNYVLRFEPGQLPPVNAFWSLTMYDMPGQLLVANPLNRYLINSPMLPALKKDGDGGITLYVQRGSPGADKESNWLPAPNGAFMMVIRLYWPKPEAFDGRWKAPAAKLAK